MCVEEGVRADGGCRTGRDTGLSGNFQEKLKSSCEGAEEGAAQRNVCEGAVTNPRGLLVCSINIINR